MNFQLFAVIGFRTVFTLALLISFISCSPARAQAQDKTPASTNEEARSPVWDSESQYYQAMVDNVRQLDTIISKEALQRVISSFERIARVEKDKALPQYYMAFALATLAFREKDVDEIDVLCDRSERALSKAEAASGVSKADILVIRALVQYARLMVDFMGRGMEASQRAERLLREGHELDKENPRVLSMLAQHYLRIPAQVGGSREKFCQLAGLASEAYEAEKAGMVSGIYPIVPHWGQQDLLEAKAEYCPRKPAAGTKKQP